jgi:hypothetical protein
MSEEYIKEFAREAVQSVVRRGLYAVLREMAEMAIDSKRFHVAIVVTPKPEYSALDCATVGVNNPRLNCISGNTILDLGVMKGNDGDSVEALLRSLVERLDCIDDTVSSALDMAMVSHDEVKDQPSPQHAN